MLSFAVHMMRCADAYNDVRIPGTVVHKTRAAISICLILFDGEHGAGIIVFFFHSFRRRPLSSSRTVKTGFQFHFSISKFFNGNTSTYPSTCRSKFGRVRRQVQNRHRSKDPVGQLFCFTLLSLSFSHLPSSWRQATSHICDAGCGANVCLQLSVFSFSCLFL